MVYRPLLGVLVPLVGTLCLAGDTPPPPTGEPGRAAAAPYVDDADGRRIARLQLAAPSDPGAAPLRLTVSATGAEVEPISGYEGVAGANRFTAEQLGRILEGSRPLSIRSRDLDTGAASPARVFAGRRGRVPQRRQRTDGTIDYRALNPGGNLPLELHVEAGPFAVGRHEVELLLGGEPRLRISLDRRADGIHFERIESLGSHANGSKGAIPPLRSSALTLSFAQDLGALFQEQPERKLPPAPPPVVDAEWAKRDIEGKWVLYARDIAKRPDAGLQWVRFLVDRKEYALLEWVALSEPGAFGSWMIGRSLADAKAPQWVRDAMWLRVGIFGHGDFEAQALLGEQPGPVLWWLRKHPGVAPEMVEQFEKENVKPVESPDLLPPLKPQDVFGLLDAPADVEEFGGRTKAEPGKTYVHQVVRAIDGYVMGGTRGAPWEPKLLALTRHPNPVLRREAYLAYTHKRFTPPPPVDLAKVIDDGAEPADVREAATLAMSYADHPMVYAKLHHLAADPRHPAWSAAVSRLGDLGDGFTEGRLDQLKGLSADQAELVRNSAERIAERQAQVAAAITRDDEGSGQAARQVLVERLHRAAWVTLHGDPLEKTLIPWTIDTTGAEAKASGTVPRSLEDIVANGTKAAGKDAGDAEDAELEARVKRYAAEILKTPAG